MPNDEENKKPDLKKPGLGDRILNYVPWRIALTVAAFAIPVAGPVLGTVAAALTYGNYRKNNRTEDPTSKPGNEPDKSNDEESKNKESKKESAQPDRLKKFLFRISAVVIGFLLGGPIGALIAGIFVGVDIASNGKFIQGTEKLLDAGYDALIWSKDKVLEGGKWAVDKVRGSEKDQETGKAAEEGREVGNKSTFYTPEQSGPEVDGSATSQKMTSEAQGQVGRAGETLVQAANPNYTGGIKAKENLQQSSPTNGQGVGNSGEQRIPGLQKEAIKEGETLVKSGALDGRGGDSKEKIIDGKEVKGTQSEGLLKQREEKKSASQGAVRGG